LCVVFDAIVPSVTVAPVEQASRERRVGVRVPVNRDPRSAKATREGLRMSFTKKDRKDRSISGITFPSQRFADAIAGALRREYGETHAAVKTVVALTRANERAVKNWFDARNAPKGEFLVELCRHSDQVFETFLLMAGRDKQVKAKRIVDAVDRLRELLVLLDGLQTT